MEYFLTGNSLLLSTAENISAKYLCEGEMKLQQGPLRPCSDALCPHKASLWPPATSHWSTGKALTGSYLSQKLSGPLFSLPSVFLYWKTILPPPSPTAGGSPAPGLAGDAAWRGDAAPVSFQGTLCWGRRCEKAVPLPRQRGGDGERLDR